MHSFTSRAFIWYLKFFAPLVDWLGASVLGESLVLLGPITDDAL